MPLPSEEPSAAGRPVVADIFCRVIDNFGDIGVCWRLARRLAHGHGWSVRLWVDDLRSFERLLPAAARGDGACVDGIRVIAWREPLAAPVPAPGDVVIEAFSCDPPPAFVAQLRPHHVWLNLEYLSAEAWVESCHALPSPQPNGVLKHFFFPGFTLATGGLLREPGLLAARDRFQASESERETFLSRIGVPSAQARLAAAGKSEVVSVFCYPSAPVAALCAALRQRARNCLLLLADGIATDIATGQQDNLYVVRLPFLPQDDFDRVLWSAGLNFVRGEDSFVRAQWAGRPMIWHIYPQADAAHRGKLAAWLARYPAPAEARVAHDAWNGELPAQDIVPALKGALEPALLRAWSADALDWSRTLAGQPELADSVADFCARRLE